jgi:hypothetical protein
LFGSSKKTTASGSDAGYSAGQGAGQGGSTDGSAKPGAVSPTKRSGNGSAEVEGSTKGSIKITLRPNAKADHGSVQGTAREGAASASGNNVHPEKSGGSPKKKTKIGRKGGCPGGEAWEG